MAWTVVETQRTTEEAIYGLDRGSRQTTEEVLLTWTEFESALFSCGPLLGPVGLLAKPLDQVTWRQKPR